MRRLLSSELSTTGLLHTAYNLLMILKSFNCFCEHRLQGNGVGVGLVTFNWITHLVFLCLRNLYNGIHDITSVSPTTWAQQVRLGQYSLGQILDSVSHAHGRRTHLYVVNHLYITLKVIVPSFSSNTWLI